LKAALVDYNAHPSHIAEEDEPIHADLLVALNGMICEKDR
jgi:hypothetical protein